jgi:hypothetical protein
MREPPAEVGACVVGRESDGRLEVPQGVRQVRLVGVDTPAVVVGGGVGRFQADGLGEVAQSLVVLSLPLVREAPAEVRAGVRRVARDAPGEARDGEVVILLVQRVEALLEVVRGGRRGAGGCRLRMRSGRRVAAGRPRVQEPDDAAGRVARLAVECAAETKELLDLIDAQLPVEMRGDYLRLRAGEWASVPIPRRRAVRHKVAEILRDAGVDVAVEPDEQKVGRAD